MNSGILLFFIFTYTFGKTFILNENNNEVNKFWSRYDLSKVPGDERSLNNNIQVKEVSQSRNYLPDLPTYLTKKYCPPNTIFDGANCIVIPTQEYQQHHVKWDFVYQNYLFVNIDSNYSCPPNTTDDGVYKDGRNCATHIYIGDNYWSRNAFVYYNALYVTPLKQVAQNRNINVSNRPDWNTGKFFYTDLSGKSYQCSASIVAGNIVLTAAHCVSDDYGHMYTNLMFQSKAYERTTGVSKCFIPDSRSNCVSDYAFCKANTKVTAGWLGIKFASASNDVLTIITLNTYNHVIYFPYIIDIFNLYEFYITDSVGSSGAPIIEGYNNSNQVYGNFVVGVKSCADYSGDEYNNKRYYQSYGTMFNQETYAVYQEALS